MKLFILRPRTIENLSLKIQGGCILVGQIKSFTMHSYMANSTQSLHFLQIFDVALLCKCLIGKSVLAIHLRVMFIKPSAVLICNFNSEVDFGRGRL